MASMRAARFETRVLSSLTKVFADEELTAKPFRNASCLLGEVFSFQVAYRSAVRIEGVRVGVDSKLARFIEVRSVGLVPSELPGHAFDDNVLRTTPGLYPDPLYPLTDGLMAFPGQ